MQIACPQCAMQYVLDERLLPPGGAPVQCTRCSHVFTAVPGGPQRPTTQVFGAVTPGQGGSGAAPARTATQVFGGGGAAPPPAGAPASEVRSTQVFGSAPPRASTQVFGSSSPEAAPPRASTQVFGAAPAEGAPARASTQVFGSATPSAPAAPPARASTQVFGTPAAGAPPARASTQVFGSGAAQGSLPAPAEEGRAATPRASTQVFGSPAGAPGPAGSETPAGPPQSFGAPAPPARASTQVFGQPASEGKAPAPRPARLDLPPDLLPDRGARAEPSARSTPASQPLRTRAGLWLLLLAGLIALLAFFAWRTVHRRTAAFPVEAITSRDTAAALLRRDDTASRQKAIASLREVVAAHPDFVEAQAELAVALAFELDDLRFERVQRAAQLRRTQRERASLERARAPEGWEQRVQQIRAEEARSAEVLASLAGRGEEAGRASDAAQRALQQEPDAEAPASERLARARALALVAAVLGGPGAPARIEQLRAAGETQGWDAIAQAEHALNAPRVSTEARVAAAQALEQLRQRDASFLRAYVLGARLALAQQDPSTAASLADMALALNPAHDVARGLRAVAPKGRTEASPAD